MCWRGTSELVWVDDWPLSVDYRGKKWFCFGNVAGKVNGITFDDKRSFPRSVYKWCKKKKTSPALCHFPEKLEPDWSASRNQELAGESFFSCCHIAFMIWSHEDEVVSSVDLLWNAIRDSNQCVTMGHLPSNIKLYWSDIDVAFCHHGFLFVQDLASLQMMMCIRELRFISAAIHFKPLYNCRKYAMWPTSPHTTSLALIVILRAHLAHLAQIGNHPKCHKMLIKFAGSVWSNKNTTEDLIGFVLIH